MAEYLHPGVYIEETSYRSPPFEGVSTSTAGLVGRTRKGAEGKPTLVTSFTEFVRNFGQPFPIVGGTTPQLGDYLGHAVRAFFDNGGKRAYIVRTLAADAQAATSQLVMGKVYRLPGTTTVRGPTSTIPLDNVRGIDAGTKLDIYARVPNAPPVLRTQVTVNAIDCVRNTITIAGQLGAGFTLAPGSTFLVDHNHLPGGAGPTFSARSRGEDGNAISVQIRPADGNAMRLTTQRFFRAFPQIATFSGQTGDTGPGSGANQTFVAKTLGVVAIGDTVSFDGPNAETAKITKVDLTPPAKILTTTNATPMTVSSGTITLSARGGASISPAIPLYTLAAGEKVVTTAGDVTLPYGALPVLETGDQITIGGIITTLTADPDFTTPANTVTIDTLASAHPATNITIANTGDLDAAAHIKRLVVADTTGLVGLASQKIAITNGTTTVQAEVLLVDATKGVVVVQGTSAIPDDWKSFELLQVAGTTNAVTVASTAGFYTGGIVELFDGATNTSTTFHVAAVDPGTRQVTLDAAPPAISVDPDPTKRNVYLRTLEIDVLVYEEGTLVETFPGLSWNPAPGTDAMDRWFIDAINDPDNGSQLVSVAWTPLPGTFDETTQPNTPDGFPYALGQTQTGTNGSALIDTDLIGHDDGPGQRFGIEALKEKTDIALVAVPGVTDQEVQQALLTHCENLKYRFAILDGRQGQSDITQIEAHRGNYDSHYGGYYTPWLKTIDLNTGHTMLAPPSGYVLGICARVDDERGVHKAPANEVVRNILDIELPFTDGEQDVLNPQGINLIRAFEGRGIRVWGARTTTSDAEWKYVNVRRLFIFLEHSIDNNTQWVVFEPNNEALWERVKESIESFLFGVWKTGALMGTKPEDAYFVRCDRTTMTQDDIDNGRLVCLIGVAPTYPAEFVIFRIGQFTASTNQA